MYLKSKINQSLVCMVLCCTFFVGKLHAHVNCGATNGLSEQANESGAKSFNLFLDGEIVDKKAWCDESSGFVLFANFGRIREDKSALFGSILSHETRLKMAGWDVSPDNQYQTVMYDIPNDTTVFFVNGEHNGYISIDWPVIFDEVVINLIAKPLLPNRGNQIYFQTSTQAIELWEELDSYDGKMSVTLKGLSKYGQGQLIFKERSGIFILDNIWVK